MRSVGPDDPGMAAAVESLKRGEIVAYPTETVYGLGVNPSTETALDALFRLKRRDPNNPVLILIGAPAQLNAFAASISETAQSYMRKFWPGPLSLLFPARPEVPAPLLNREGLVCVRWSSHPIAARLAIAFGGGITSTSANLSGGKPARSVAELPAEGVSVCIDGGTCVGGRVSTIFNPETCTILREGAISRAELDAFAGNT